MKSVELKYEDDYWIVTLETANVFTWLFNKFIKVNLTVHHKVKE